ncbi:MAG: orotate phosphoribosyltransferase [Alicyclobacillus sp.]|nr:orotate phosphoribosyltransferase [Alicyclobacillus sp.]
MADQTEPSWTWPRAGELARAILEIGAVEFRPEAPFTWSSGWLSPIYCDMRVVLAHPDVWNLAVEGMVAALDAVGGTMDVIAGTSTAGIPHAAALARALRLPMAYVRSSAKAHGKQRRVEGCSGPGLRTVLLEDTFSTGRSALEAVSALREEQMYVAATLGIYSYDFELFREKARAANVPVLRLVGFDELVDAALVSERIRAEDLRVLQAWREQPDAYGKR